jgi:predicted transcriptional regulator
MVGDGSTVLPLDGRRSNIQLIAEILRLLRLGEVGKTEVMYAVRLSHYQTQKYLSRLVEIGLIDQSAADGHQPAYRITAKGLDLLGRIEQMQEMLQMREIPGIIHSPELKVDEAPCSRMLKRLRDALRHRQGDQAE